MEIFVFLQDVLDSLEFARGSANSTWGSVRASMGHPEPFPVKYVAIGNEDCGKKFYRGKYVSYIFIASFFIVYRSMTCAYGQFLPDVCLLGKKLK